MFNEHMRFVLVSDQIDPSYWKGKTSYNVLVEVDTRDGEGGNGDFGDGSFSNCSRFTIEEIKRGRYRFYYQRGGAMCFHKKGDPDPIPESEQLLTGDVSSNGLVDYGLSSKPPVKKTDSCYVFSQCINLTSLIMCAIAIFTLIIRFTQTHSWVYVVIAAFTFLFGCMVLWDAAIRKK